MKVINNGYVQFEDIKIEDVSDTDNQFIDLESNHHLVYFSNLSLRNIAGASTNFGQLIRLNNLENTTTIIDQMHASNIDLWERTLLSSVSNLNQLQIRNSVIENINITSSDHIIESGQIKSLIFNNISVFNVKLNENINADGVILYLSTLDLDSELDSAIEDIIIDNSEISFVSFGTLINDSPNHKSISFNNISLKNAYIEGNRALISTDGFERDADIDISMSNLSFSNISFSRNGKLIEFKQQLPTYLTVTESSFVDLNAAVLSIESSNLQNTDLKTKIQVRNTLFNNINNQFNSFINVNEGGWLEINN